MTLQEIKTAIENGNKVFWSHTGYEVKKDKIGQYLIVCTMNGNCIGLEGNFMNEDYSINEEKSIKEFFIK